MRLRVEIVREGDGLLTCSAGETERPLYGEAERNEAEWPRIWEDVEGCAAGETDCPSYLEAERDEAE